jgi:hypothetical protein
MRKAQFGGLSEAMTGTTKRNGREKNDTVSRTGWMERCCAVASSQELALA